MSGQRFRGDEKGEEGGPHSEDLWGMISKLESLLGPRKRVDASKECLQSQEVVKRLRGVLGVPRAAKDSLCGVYILK